ncbi:hypothetical protein [Leptolinea tardivitalis]|uniref:Uncharacterized protein n=1 Tax=Leptolinea tardivitalis TaxID=229920 RepID=A0A0P6WSK2_9CHLR|nr:hypothetical protein [Leptolinea tardivitalis]KPL69956.1 hypothetical protein ADM99_16670 [Leptolinea tardivitalis]GAP20594.1 hypothetical protein LTAR_00788 [Leptolinea tardivitalis]
MNEMELLESKLGNLLKPRQANPDFVAELKSRLTYEPVISVETRKKYKAIWVIASALFVGGLVVFILSLLSGRSDRKMI